MSNLIRFEFYNNFDIWYDLYQENGGDPNYVIDIFLNFERSYNWMTYELRDAYGDGMDYGNGYGGEGKFAICDFSEIGDGYIKLGCLKIKGNASF